MLAVIDLGEALVFFFFVFGVHFLRSLSYW
jgi:hypothetical protein